MQFMFQVIDSFTITADSLARPESAELYGDREGVVAIPAPEQASTIDLPAGTPMRLHRPDGTTTLLTLTATLCPHHTIGLFFAALTSADIPRLSQLEPLSPGPA